jgi:hypothetical protein
MGHVPGLRIEAHDAIGDGDDLVARGGLRIGIGGGRQYRQRYCQWQKGLTHRFSLRFQDSLAMPDFPAASKTARSGTGIQMAGANFVRSSERPALRDQPRG